jgi:MtN3 and saliva related transmembrane protein
MRSIDWIGYLAAILTIISFVPQALQNWRTKITNGISLRMYILFTCGVTRWLICGILIMAWPMILANTIIVILTCIVLSLKLRHG